jgi:6-phosphofructokinase 1
MSENSQPAQPRKRLGILVGGGPAPGINGVIAGATIEALRNGLEVVGILEGFKHLSKGDGTKTINMTEELAQQVRLRGGSVLRTARDNPTKKDKVTRQDKMDKVASALRAMGLDYLVTIGGDDTAFSAYRTSEVLAGEIRVVHVPKTIDNDLPLPGNAPTFGYNTARYFGSLLVKNLVEDAKTAGRWYVVVAMGRTAGHLAQGMGVVGGADLTIIPEEFPGVREGKPACSIDTLCKIIEGAVFKARAKGQTSGVAVVAEGVGVLMEDELSKMAPIVEVDYDEHGHFRLGEVPLGLILKRRLKERFAARADKLTFTDVTIGYELRCAEPVPFDVDYVQQLSWGAVRYLLALGGATYGGGAMMSVQSGEAVPIPFTDILNMETGKTSVRRVNLNQDTYRAARSVMTRLEAEDMQDEGLVSAMAAAALMTAEAFREEYAPVAGL